MKTRPIKYALAALALLSIINSQLSTSFAATTITVTNRYAYGANIGWVDGCGDTNNGAVIGEYVCSGYLYAANVGWINLGNGSPASGSGYANNSATDYGVNVNGLGGLSGYAWGANIGWVKFESTGAPKVDVVTGKFSGYAWSANCGWISLSNASAVVQTGSIARGTDTDGDGIADGWELSEFGNLTTANATSDYDKDGMTDRQEYWAATNPQDDWEKLYIMGFTRNAGGVANRVELKWMSTSVRCYAIDVCTNLSPSSAWRPYTTGYENLLGWNNLVFTDTAPRRFYRVRVVRPLMP
jgi:hypothetical protein